MKHTYCIERWKGGVLVQTHRPKLSGLVGARSEARAAAIAYESNATSWGKLLDFVRAIDMYTGHVVATYVSKGAGKARRL